MTTKLDDLLRDTIGGLADEARPADLARGALRQARGMRTRRRAGAGAAVAAGVLAVGALGSVVLPGWHPLPPAGGITQTATPAPSTTPVLPANGPISVQGNLVVLAAATSDGTGTWVYDRAHDRYTRLPYRDVIPAPAGNQVAIVAADRNRLTILLVEQRVAEALETCDRGYVLETGRVAMEGTHKTLMSDERVRRAYLGM